ncbi:hypothetical protein GLYMA_07G015666v4 [Glycine max]|nr:hypothetical protein GLYMA_07G015666v4 [Glycine max]
MLKVFFLVVIWSNCILPHMRCHVKELACDMGCHVEASAVEGPEKRQYLFFPFLIKNVVTRLRGMERG